MDFWNIIFNRPTADTGNLKSYGSSIVKFLMKYIYNIYLYHQEMALKNTRIMFLYVTSIVIFLFIFFYYFNKLRKKVTKPRFRKRDKVLFFGRKVLRKVRSSIQGTNRLRGKKRQMVVKFAKRLLRLKKELPLELKVKEPSQAFLNEEFYDPTEHDLPEELLYMVKSIRVFGFFEKPLFLKLCQKMEVITVMKGEFLFNIGESDDSIYIVKSGEIKVTSTEPDGTTMVLKNVLAGESIASMLSVVDFLSGYPSQFKTISASAVQDSQILKLKINVLKQIVDEYPEMLIRVVQIIMVRLQRVTFTSLYKYLGLTTELINPGTIPQSKRSNFASINTMNVLRKSSPSKISSRSHVRSFSNADAIDLRELMNKSESEKPSVITSETSGEKQRQPETPESAKAFLMKRKKSILVDDRTAGMSYEDLINFAIADLKTILKIDDEQELRKHICIKEFQRDTCLASEESRNDNSSSLILLLSGSISVSQKLIDSEDENYLYSVYPGELIGALDVLTGEESIFTIRTRQNSKVAVISKDSVFEIMTLYPHVALSLAHTVIQRLSPFVRQIDFALDWNHYDSGRAIYRINEPSDCTFIVLSGRLRSVITLSNGKRELSGEYGKGDLVGIVELITGTPRSSTVIAVRDSELAKLPNGLLEAIKRKFPVVVLRLIHLLGHRLLAGGLHSSTSGKISDMGSRPSGSNFSTVALLSISDDVPLHAFAYELYHALTVIGPTALLTSDSVKKMLGPKALDRQSEYRLCHWLGVEEDKNKIVLYQCDKGYSAWTQRCIRQADCILIVGLGENEPTVGEVEKQLQYLSVRTQKELVLLHRLDGPRPKNTVEWLNMRDWCSSNHHIRCPKRVFIKRSPSKVREYYEDEVKYHVPSPFSDFSRLARFLTGKSIGLVLGGGGARGIAHVGMIKAISEAGIPIDMVGGVSIGAFMGALWCQENNLTTFIQKAKAWSASMTSYWHQILDLTYPATAMFTGHAFNRSIYEIFGDTQIEDLWLPYFTVTTDITSSCPRIHRHGSLWRYVRASMSLSGYLPPLCDPVDGHLLLDGGYVNNLPANIMHDVMGAETILAIDVGSQDNVDLTNYGDTLSGWWLLWKRWNPFTQPVRVPNLPEIQTRLAYVCCEKQLEEVKSSDYCIYIRPPINGFKTLQFKSFPEIMAVGYHHGQTVFGASKLNEQRTTMLNFMMKDKNRRLSMVPSESTGSLNECLAAASSIGYRMQSPVSRKHSFTDLAERICNIHMTPSSTVRSDFDDISEDDDEYHSEPDIHNYDDEDMENIRSCIDRKISAEV